MKEVVFTQGLSVKQSERLLEDIESVSLSARLLLNLMEAVKRDVEAMLNGNSSEKGSELE